MTKKLNLEEVKVASVDDYIEYYLEKVEVTLASLDYKQKLHFLLSNLNEYLDAPSPLDEYLPNEEAQVKPAPTEAQVQFLSASKKQLTEAQRVIIRCEIENRLIEEEFPKECVVM